MKLGSPRNAAQGKVRKAGREQHSSFDTFPAQPGGSQGPCGCWAKGRSGTGMLKLKDGMGLGWGVHGTSEESGAQGAQEWCREVCVKM